LTSKKRLSNISTAYSQIL